MADIYVGLDCEMTGTSLDVHDVCQIGVYLPGHDSFVGPTAAIDALYSRRQVRVDTLRRSSREIVDGLQLNRRAISRTLRPCARNSAMPSRSELDR